MVRIITIRLPHIYYYYWGLGPLRFAHFRVFRRSGRRRRPPRRRQGRDWFLGFSQGPALTLAAAVAAALAAPLVIPVHALCAAQQLCSGSGGYYYYYY